jgi:hypothetical protein
MNLKDYSILRLTIAMRNIRGVYANTENEPSAYSCKVDAYF